MASASRELAVLRVARALADPTRFRLLRAIVARAEISCRELVARLPVSQATVSHHLKVLADAGLVAARQVGPYHLYRAVDGALEAHAQDLTALAGAGRRRPGRNGAGARRRVDPPRAARPARAAPKPVPQAASPSRSP